LLDKYSVAWQQVSEWDVLFDESSPAFALATSPQALWNDTSNRRVSYPVFGSWIANRVVKIALSKVSSPTSNVGIRIETDNSGLPSGTLVDPNAVLTIDRTKVSNSGTVSAYIPVVDDDDISLSLTSTAGATVRRWYRIQAKVTGAITTVNKNASSLWTTVRVTNDSGVELGRALFVGNVATLDVPIISWQTYRVQVWTPWAAPGTVGYIYATWVTYPKVRTNIDYIGWINDSSPIANEWYNIDSIETTERFAFPADITIPKWQRVHLVIFPWTYWSETINATNHYRLWYRNIITSTRGLSTYNWTIYSAPNSSAFPYVDSTLFLNKLLAKTDASLSYKLPSTFAKIATQNKNAGEICHAAFYWYTELISWVTDGLYYISDGAWVISKTPGTNQYIIWKGNNNWSLLLEWSVIYLDTFEASVTTITSSNSYNNWVGGTAVNSTAVYLPSGGTISSHMVYTWFSNNFGSTYWRVQISDNGITWWTTIFTKNFWAPNSTNLSSSCTLTINPWKYVRISTDIWGWSGNRSIAMEGFVQNKINPT
jgi:hypothetical protein